MAVDWDKPVNADSYETGVLSVLNEKLDGAAAMEFVGDTNVPTGAIRYNSLLPGFERWGGAAWAEVVPFPTNHIGGLITSNDAGDAAHDVNVAAGSCRDSTDVENMRLTTEIAKQIDAAWALGDDAGGLDAGAVGADTMYAVWLIKRNDTGVVDALISTSFTAPTMPGSYDRKRLVGAVCTDAGSDVIAYVQSGDYFRYTGDVIQDISDAVLVSNVFKTDALSVAPKSLAHVYGITTNAATTSTLGRLCIKYKGAADITADAEAFSVITTNATFDQTGGIGMVLVDVNREIEYAVLEADGVSDIVISALGFTMLTRREP